MISKSIIRNTLELCWGKIADEFKYYGDDLWLFDDKGELVFVKFHIHSHFGASSQVLRSRPELMKYTRMAAPLHTFPKKLEKLLNEPVNHIIYKDNVIINYPGAELYKGKMNVYNPCQGFYVLIDDDRRVLHCIIQSLSEFEFQLTSKQDRVSLSALDKELSCIVLSLWAEHWIYNDDEELLPKMVNKWQKQLNNIGHRFPENLRKYAYDTIEYWKEMAEEEVFEV